MSSNDSPLAQAVRALQAADNASLEQSLQVPEHHHKAVTAVITGLKYSPEAMVQLIIDNPNFTHAQYGLAFGRTAGWFAAILANEAFQEAIEQRASEVSDPTLTATIEERLRALALRSLTVLQRKLDSNEVADFTVLKAAELGIKGLGLGNTQPVQVAAPAGTVDSLAERLVAALEKQRGNVRKPVVVIQDAELVEVSP